MLAVISSRSAWSSVRIDPSTELEGHVAGEAVGDKDVGGAFEDVAAFGIAAEIEIGRREQLARLERELVPLLRLLADGEEAYRGFAMPRISSAKTAPIVANWSRCSARQSAFAPASIEDGRAALRGDGNGDRRRRTPGRRRNWTRPAASIAPVFPGDTTASASPSATALTARTSELSFFVRRASAGFSSMATTWVVGTSSSPPVSSSSEPKMTGSIAVRRGFGAPSITARPTVAAHCIDGDPGSWPRAYGAWMRNGSTSRPLYVPQVGQTRCGRFGWPHVGQTLTFGALIACVARRLSRRDFEVFRFGTAMAARPL